MSLFQRRSEIKGNVEKIVEKLKKSAPGIKVVYDENLEAAGKWSPKNKTITINPYYAGTDTPIHEYGHILIDAIGYNNKVIQAAINQLKGSKLWKQTESRYPELNEEGLAKEVLAEAIGVEGAGIFDKEADKSKFRTYLEYIFDWLKTKLGINKNIAKSLAKQVISGRGVKTEVDKTESEKFQKPKFTEEEKAAYKQQQKEQRKAEREEIKEMMGEDKNLKSKSLDELIEMYETITAFSPSSKRDVYNNIKEEIEEEDEKPFKTSNRFKKRATQNVRLKTKNSELSRENQQLKQQLIALNRMRLEEESEQFRNIAEKALSENVPDVALEAQKYYHDTTQKLRELEHVQPTTIPEDYAEAQQKFIEKHSYLKVNPEAQRILHSVRVKLDTMYAMNGDDDEIGSPKYMRQMDKMLSKRMVEELDINVEGKTKRKARYVAEPKPTMKKAKLNLSAADKKYMQSIINLVGEENKDIVKKSFLKERRR